MATLSALIGQTVGTNGELHVVRLLGAGAMGEVFEGVDRDGRRAAIKFLNDRCASDPHVRARFRREVEISIRVDSPYVARIVMVGDHEGRPWIAFEFLDGEPLDVRLRRVRTLWPEEARWVVAHVLEGLRAAHALGVIHRDIKPANIFLEAGVDRARVLDFGISKIEKRRAGSASSNLTGADTTLGTLEYMSPEQLRNASDVDGKTDLYAVGVTAFRALTGRLPFDGRTKMEIVAFKYDRPPLSLALATGAAWPDAFEAFFVSALARDPSVRISSANEMLARWRSLFSDKIDAALGDSSPQSAPGSVDSATDVGVTK